MFIAFGLASLVVAVPFLWRSLPWKRLLAYSSLEHMGVIALGIGFGTPLAIAGVVLHVAGHALAKSLGFYAAIPLLRDDPARGQPHAPTGVAGGEPRRPPRRWASACVRPRRPAALAAVPQRAADPARRRRGRRSARQRDRAGLGSRWASSGCSTR